MGQIARPPQQIELVLVRPILVPAVNRFPANRVDREKGIRLGEEHEVHATCLEQIFQLGRKTGLIPDGWTLSGNGAHGNINVRGGRDRRSFGFAGKKGKDLLALAPENIHGVQMVSVC